MFVIGLVFFYGSRLVSTLEFSNFQFFVGLMVRMLPSELYIFDTSPISELCFSAINVGNIFSYAP
jgi:ATP-binding cassette subfamily B (MDR/TAP) protein 1